MTTVMEMGAAAEEAGWHMDAIFYQIYVRGFQDSSRDGNGDLQGVIEQLDYIQNLGVSCLWLMPIFPSPLKDDGYDVADFIGIDPSIGNLDDFQQLTQAAHQRNLRIITDLVISHTSSQHPWFQSARQGVHSPFHEYYVWRDDDTGYRDARVIFQDSKTSNWSWDPVAKRYYWHRFYSHQPDLNYDHPAVQEEMLNVMRFWLDLGIDGFRVDAVPYLFEREGSSCENLPETHAFCRRMRALMDRDYPDCMLLAEANQWPQDLVAYFGGGDEFHMAFNFPLMPRIFLAVRREESEPLREIIEGLPPIPANCQWATFLRNHDELTLEMVTDADRDYLYNEYARDPRMKHNLGIRRRLAPLMDNDRRRIELLYNLLFSLPGAPVIYYGDEIGMGDNIYLGDRNGVRTPMQWSGDRNAGFSRADPSMLYQPVIADPVYHYQAVNVEAQLRSPTSLLHWLRQLLRLRSSDPLFSRGAIQFLGSSNRRILAFLRCYRGRQALVVHNLSAAVQPVHLDLAFLAGWHPVLLGGGHGGGRPGLPGGHGLSAPAGGGLSAERGLPLAAITNHAATALNVATPGYANHGFPSIEARPYFLNLAPYASLWFRLEAPGPI